MTIAHLIFISTPGDNEAIATESLADEDRITHNYLNLEEILNLRKFDANYVIGMLKEDLFSEARKQTLLEYLPFNLVADGDTHNASEGKAMGIQKRIDPIARVKAKVLMTA